MAHFYSAGQGTLLALPQCSVFLTTGISTAQANRLWEELANANPGLVGTLDALTTSLDPSMQTLPDFVAVQFESELQVQGVPHRDVRIACRGNISVEVRTHDGLTQSLTGLDASMWRESAFSGATVLVAGAAQRSSVPLVFGCVQTGGFSWSASVQAVVQELVPVPQHQEPSIQPDLGVTLCELPEEWVVEPSVPDAPAAAEPRSTAPPLPMTQTPPLIQQNSNAVPAARMDPATEVITAAPGAPYHGTVQFAHGESVDLGPAIVVGRKPSISGSGAHPNAVLVTVPSPGKDISRNHLGIHMDQGYVIVTDLNSVNGTVLKRAGQPERRLNPKEGTLILNGDVVDLGDGAVLTFTGLN